MYVRSAKSWHNRRTLADHDQRRGAGSGRQARLRRFYHLFRTKHTGPERDPIAIGVGVFIGCTPLYGLHLLLSILAADLLKLNRFKVYLAANISNPLFFPFLIFAEVQTGALIRRGSAHALTRDAIASTSPWVFGADLVVGSIAVGAVLAITLGAVTYFGLRPRDADRPFAALADAAADRFAAVSFTAWEFANAKLRLDPLYRTVMNRAVLPGGGTLLDIGCGQGLALALLVVARDGSDPASGARGAWPVYSRLVGIETRPRIARLAVNALEGPDVSILSADARSTPLAPADAILLFDVLHMMPIASQNQLLTEVKRALRPDGIVLVREANASSGWRFLLVRIGNRAKAVLGFNWRQAFAFRRPSDWLASFRAAGFDVVELPGPEGHPFGNTLFRLTHSPESAQRAAILNA